MKKLFVILLIAMVCGNLAYAANNSDVTQTGISNLANVNQNTSGKDVTIVQTGDYNDADVEQLGPSGPRIAAITQIGDNNIADTEQNYGGAGAAYNDASQYQDGLSNEAYITSSKQANAYQTQTGNDNYAITTQGAYNDASQTQTGNDNVAEIIQSTGGWTYSNFASQSQSGNDNWVLTEQIGKDNTAKLAQSDASYADLYQLGDGNLIEGLTSGTDGSSLDGSTLDVDQLGDNNMVGIYQANAATATVLQTGNGNTATVNQQ